jgi:hypothetical protein
MEAALASETLVSYHNPEELNLKYHRAKASELASRQI